MDPTGVVIGAVGLVLAGLVSWLVTRLTMSSQAAWEAAHRAALPWVLAGCLATLVASTISVAAAVGPARASGATPAAPVAVLVAGYVGFLSLMVMGARAGNRAVRDLPDPPT